MRIGDAAAAAGTTPRALRFYEQRGLLPAPPRTATGQREYREQDVARLRAIRELLSIGLTVEDLRSVADRLHLVDGYVEPCAGADRCACCACEPAEPGVSVAEQRIAVLDAEIGRLTGLREQLVARVRQGHRRAR
ncbi:MerR family transcriptional regulator [Streptacidiphilus albus]|uniref:MerR family transcriptional regulator n=1 Tax=Streptacidiphilus albus TaxID=105425 RepID=UPI00054BE4B3|nr:MerR family transcriptional regulator [Streptacidiphilus albus]